MDAIAGFFAALDGTDQLEVFMGGSGALRFDIRDERGRVRYWLVRSDRGVLSVSRQKADADVVLRADETVFTGIVTGHTNAMAALLRGAVEAAGRGDLLVAFQKLFPGPPGDKPGRGVAGYARRRP